jgi:hypothetical protein
MADRTIDIYESNNFIYPNVVDNSTGNVLALSDRGGVLGLRISLSDRHRIIWCGIGIKSLCED